MALFKKVNHLLILFLEQFYKKILIKILSQKYFELIKAKDTKFIFHIPLHKTLKVHKA